jgi:RimJ/RimL family protein N-acetyltransferase
MSRVRKLEGVHVFLTPLCEDDKNLFFKWMNDMEVTDYTGATEKVTTLEKEEKWIKQLSEDGAYVFSICATVGDNLIGNISLDHISHKNRTCELGIFIGSSSYRGQGYGSEAIQLMLDYAFNYLNMHTVYLYYLSCNERARRCYEKCGFKYRGHFREAIFVNGKYYDKCMMDITEGEFRSQKQGGYILNKNVGKITEDS